MADMCSNKLFIVGPKDAIEDFDNAARGPNASGDYSYLSFHKLHPDPHVPLDPIPKTDDWYNWRIKNWGTKWEVVVKPPAHTWPAGLSRAYSFDTAWASPEAFIKHVSQKWPTIEFEMKWHAPGDNRSGMYVYKAGKCLQRQRSPGNKWFMHQRQIDMTLNANWDWDWDKCAGSLTKR